MNTQEIMETTVAAEAASENKNQSVFKEFLSSKLFLMYLISVGAMVFTFSLASILNLFFFGATGTIAISAVRVSSVVWSRFGYFLVALVKGFKTATLIIVFINIIKLFKNKNSFTHENVNVMSKIPAVFHLYSLFTLIDCGFFAVAAVANPFSEKVFAFLDMLSLYKMLDLNVEKVSLVVKIIFVILVVGFGLFQYVMYSDMKQTYSDLVGAARIEGYLSGKKVSVILPYVYAGINFVFAIVMFLNGSWVSALMNLSLAAYLVVNALFMKSVHSKIFGK
ncbi:MAG: hypothetical protein J6Q68_02555 [Clostridia bacterium]|nr:hypothetical protein [Clostridia bacterium]